MGQQVGLLERRVVVRPISIVKTISKLTNSFTMKKFLAMFCLFIALFNEMEAKPIEGKTRSTLQVVSERGSFDTGDWGSGTAGENPEGCTGYNCNYDDTDREDEEDTGEDDDDNNSDEETEDEEEEEEEEGGGNDDD